jgi:hypothetical protein
LAEGLFAAARCAAQQPFQKHTAVANFQQPPLISSQFVEIKMARCSKTHLKSSQGIGHAV